ncbi:thioredoxin [Candidatus Bathyarchaeota archaeon]|nr:MAG: thioredoxin [Candidatus Bathyarchaeota archaeon]
MSEEDEELKRIKLKKLREMVKESLKKKEGVKEKVINKPVKVTDNDFGNFVKSHQLVVIDCWAPWCGPCLYVAPVIEELARDYAGKIVFGKLNVDENPVTATAYGIMSIPTLLVFKNGKLVDRIIGAMPRQLLEPRITRHL